METSEPPNKHEILYYLFLFVINVIGPLFLILLLLDVGSDKANLLITSGGFAAALIIDVVAISMCLEDREKVKKPQGGPSEKPTDNKVQEEKDIPETSTTLPNTVRWWTTKEDQIL